MRLATTMAWVVASHGHGHPKVGLSCCGTQGSEASMAAVHTQQLGLQPSLEWCGRAGACAGMFGGRSSPSGALAHFGSLFAVQKLAILCVYSLCFNFPLLCLSCRDPCLTEPCSSPVPSMRCGNRVDSWLLVLPPIRVRIARFFLWPCFLLYFGAFGALREVLVCFLCPTDVLLGEEVAVGASAHCCPAAMGVQSP